MVLVQPGNADTAAGIFLPLTYIRARDANGTVVISPSDHFVFPEARFLGEVIYAVRASEKLPTRLLLLAARPTSPESDYGWIQPAADLTCFGARPVRAVTAFLEKPEPALAELAFRSGALWNTLVMVGKVETIWNLGRRVLPNMVALFERLGDAIDTPKEPEILRAIYERMPRLNFSRDLLAHVPGDTAVMQMQGVWWSDWGSPDRIVQTLTRLGAGPALIAEQLRAAVAERWSGAPLPHGEAMRRQFD
jgi:mannose-1-phosphate guanylyltransferase